VGPAGYDADSWTGAIVPKRVPADVVAQIQAEIVRVTNLVDARAPPRRRLRAGRQHVRGVRRTDQE
jgi:hypothetical protein